MKICIEVDDYILSLLKIVKDLYPELTLREFLDIEIKPQLQSFLRRNLENAVKQINWTYRIVRSVLANAER